MTTRQGNIIDGFNLVAPAYDITADVMTLGFHRLWRNRFCQFFLKKTPQKAHILDIATGTGEILFRSLTKRPDIYAYGLDLSQGMLKIAKEKSQKKSLNFKNKIEFSLGSALQLPYNNNFFDSITICWSIRSLRPLQGVLREALRVLKPGGYLFILEHGLPEIPLVRGLINRYAGSIPVLGSKLTNSKIVYPLYTTTVEGFCTGKNFVAELFEAGYTKVQYETFSGGMIYIYTAQKSPKK